MAAPTTPDTQGPPRPDLDAGLKYWNAVAQKDVSNNAVLGGLFSFSPSLSVLAFSASLPRVDAMGSRMFILTMRPELSRIPSPCQTKAEDERKQGGARRLYRALDVGAGIGRVTADVLLYLFDRIDLVEPVSAFIESGKHNATSGKWSPSLRADKAVRFWNTSIQAFLPCLAPSNHPSVTPLSSSIVGPENDWNDGSGYDVIWAQWTLGHLTDEELVQFLQKCKAALRPPSRSPSGNDSVLNQKDGDGALLQPTFERDGGLIIIKENIYVSPSDPDGDNVLFDEEDSSVTRSILFFIQFHYQKLPSSHSAFLRIFRLAGLHLVKQDLQRGFDPDLYKVHFYALQ
ncbi:uncharacterized protein VP01_191g9 [Puccinia sorghi]|uniref:Alpha N-terminal protein methyltransferase 1 n=1 Tax=Puccinia sorghi TaxID=27349 RepID=A0A0L6VEG9_9BASI|nr:uncharacterized protein VP01_191g9 [Puccinia sorghi]